MQELAVLGANDTNTVQDHEAINLEAEALADEFNRLMTTSTYKGKDVFVTNAGSEYVGLGGRGAEMTFGIGDISYTELYGSARTIDHTSGPNDNASVNLRFLPSEAVLSAPIDIASVELGVTYQITDIDGGTSAFSGGTGETALNTASDGITADSQVVDGLVFKATADDVKISGGTSAQDSFKGRVLYSDAGVSFHTLHKGATYKISGLGDADATTISRIVAKSDLASADDFVVGAEFTMNDNMDDDDADDGLNSDHFVGQILTPTGKLTRVIEAVQAKINTARVQAGSQYAALESAVAYTTDLTAQYELGYNTVNDVNFSMETAHLAKNQILQQAATAMLAQANSGQQGLLQLLQ
jgi:flagellin